MKKILYLMEVDWYWIKQRPQIIAEMLANDFDITVVYYREIFQRLPLRKENDELKKSISIPAIPYRDKNRLAHLIQKLAFYKVMKHICVYDWVWISHPLLYRYIPRSYKGKIVYDCMDNHEALCGDRRIKKMIREIEQRLVIQADVVFASSKGLLKKLKKIGAGEKVSLVRNGVVFDKVYPPKPVVKKNGKTYKIGYFGTIAGWFDFALLIQSVEKYSELEYHLWGPVSNVDVPKHPRIILEGVVEHGDLWNEVKNMDFLIMPFIVNDLVKDVDPVKLYEYISMGKPIISVYYDEIERFRGYVMFYENGDDFDRIIRTDIQNAVYSHQAQIRFLKENTWEERYIELLDRMKC